MLHIKQQKQMGNLKTKWNMKGTNCLEEIFMSSLNVAKMAHTSFGNG